MNRISKLGPIVVAALVILCAGHMALAQVDWTFEELCVEPGPPGSWDSSRHTVGDVVFDGTTWHMFLVGGQVFVPFDGPWSVGHWTWNALTQEWDPDIANNPVLSPQPGEWDGFTIYSVAVLWDGAEFKMWYGAAAAYPAPTSVGYATSPDGSVWTRPPGNPLPSLEPGAPGAWDDAGLTPSTVLFDDGIYKMWCTATEDVGSTTNWRIGYAESADGLAWTKYPDPVLVYSLPWEGHQVYYPKVVPDGAGYVMWYSGVVSGVAKIGYASSPDGIHWGKWSEQPVLPPPSLPGCWIVDSIAVVLEGDTVHGWVSYCDEIHHLTSPLEVVFFDAFETGDTSIWNTMVP